MTTCEVIIEVDQTRGYVFNCIFEVKKWWNPEFEGSHAQLSDEFIIRHGDIHYSKQQVVGLIPGKKIEWLVTDCLLNWLENKTEWTGTKMVFCVRRYGNKTIVHFKHEGLTPQMECFDKVKESWDIAIKDWLFNFIVHGTTR